MSSVAIHIFCSQVKLRPNYLTITSSISSDEPKFNEHFIRQPLCFFIFFSFLILTLSSFHSLRPFLFYLIHYFLSLFFPFPFPFSSPSFVLFISLYLSIFWVSIYTSMLYITLYSARSFCSIFKFVNYMIILVYFNSYNVFLVYRFWFILLVFIYYTSLLNIHQQRKKIWHRHPIIFYIGTAS